MDDAVHRRRAEAGAGLSEPLRDRRPPDVRVGSSTDGLAPISVVERSLAATPSQWLALLAIAGTAIAGDQITKAVVSSRVALDSSVHVVGPFSLHHVQNSGIAFGLFASATSVVIVVTAIAVVWMLSFFFRSGARHPILPIALGLVVGGSVSNLADRIRLGHVTDFLKLTFTASFNLADVFIVVGVAILVLALVAKDRPRPPRPIELTR